MRLGKTPQAIAAADLLKAETMLVVAPARAAVHWQRSFAQWQTIDRPVTILKEPPGPGTPRGAWIVSYDLARTPAMRNALLARRHDVLIGDEAHYLKNPHAVRTQAILGPRCDGVDSLVTVSRDAWGLTGTPMPNSADELWGPVCAFAPAALWDDGKPLSYQAWRRRFCIERWSDKLRKMVVLGVQNADELRARLAPHMLRRTKEEVLPEHPPVLESEIFLEPESMATDVRHIQDGDAAVLLRQIIARTLVSDDVENVVGEMLQLASDESISRLRRLTAMVKAHALAAVLTDELEQDEEKIVVMGWHPDALDVLHAALSPFGAVMLTGRTSPRDGQAAIDRFRDDPSCRVFLGQILAAGTAIDLSAARHLVFLERSWTPGDNDQAAERVQGIMQTRPVTLRDAVLADTIDEAVTRVLRRKAAGIATVLH